MTQPPDQPTQQETHPPSTTDAPAPKPLTPGMEVNPFARGANQPIFTYAMLGTIIVIFLYTLISGAVQDNRVFIDLGATFGPYIILNGEIWRLFTAMFLHSNITHIAFNGIALYSLGRDMEALYGNVRYAYIYLLAGLFGSLASLALKGFDEFSVGASGAIFGVAGMNLGFYLYYRTRLTDKGKEHFQGMLRLVAFNLVFGLVVVSINNTAHIGGLIAGIVLGYMFVPRHIVTQDGENLIIVDKGSLQSRWYFVLLSIAVFAAGLIGSIIFWRSVAAQAEIGSTIVLYLSSLF